MNKDLEYFLSLPYKIEIVPIKPEEGGGYTAHLPQFGSNAIVGDGETMIEAIESLKNIKKYIFELLIKKGAEIPEPEPDLSQYSGRFSLRMPKELHAKLTEDSKANNSSLNQHLIYLLSLRSNINQKLLINEIKSTFKECFQEVTDFIYNKIQMDTEKQKSNNSQYIPDFPKAA